MTSLAKNTPGTVSSGMGHAFAACRSANTDSCISTRRWIQQLQLYIQLQLHSQISAHSSGGLALTLAQESNEQFELTPVYP